jgi:hypothetical protein
VSPIVRIDIVSCFRHLMRGDWRRLRLQLRALLFNMRRHHDPRG